MRSYNIYDVRQMLNPYANRITHIAVAHTDYWVKDATEKQLDTWREQSGQAVRRFRNKFNQALYGKKAHRKPDQYQPIIITTVEGASHASSPDILTIHYNFALGNIPSEMSTEALNKLFRTTWEANHKLTSRDFWMQEVSDEQECWINYITKEGDRGFIDTWDIMNTQLPRHC